MMPGPLRIARASGRGFTLIEVLVALVIMAVLATMTWQGLDGILRARDGSREALDRTQRLASVITQWEQDLLALFESPSAPALAFDGRALRLTRRVDGGVALVAWTVRSGVWQRWVGTTVTRGADLRESWVRSQSLIGNEPGHLTLAENVGTWQVYFHRGGAWTNAQSSGDLMPAPVTYAAPRTPPASAAGASAPAGGASTPVPTAPTPVQPRETLPDAVRLVITLEGGRTLTRDVMLGPSSGGGG